MVLQGEDYLAFLREKVPLGRETQVTCLEEPHRPPVMVEMDQSYGLEALRLRATDYMSPGHGEGAFSGAPPLPRM